MKTMKWLLTIAVFCFLLFPAILSAMINIPTVEPFYIVSGSITPVTVSAYIPDSNLVASSVCANKIDSSGKITLLGYLNDAGTNGDKIAGDKVYSATINMVAASAGTVNLSVSAALLRQRNRITAGVELHVIAIPELATVAQYRQVVDELFDTLLTIQGEYETLNGSSTDGVVFTETLSLMVEDFLIVYTDMKAIYNYEKNHITGTAQLRNIFHYISEALKNIISSSEAYAGDNSELTFLQKMAAKLAGIDGVINNSNSALTEIEKFKENGLNPDVQKIAVWAKNMGCLDADQLSGSAYSIDREICAAEYQRTNANSKLAEATREAGKVAVKKGTTQFTGIASSGLGSLFSDYGVLVSKAVSKSFSGTIDKLIDLFVDNNTGEIGLLVGEVADEEEVKLPAGTHDVIYSFNGEQERTVVEDIVISKNLTTMVDVFSSGLVGYWKFDDPSNLGLDSSSYANNGTAAVGYVSYSGEGKLGGAARFNAGSNAGVTIPNAESLNFTGGITIAAWVKLDAINGTATIISKSDSSTGEAYALWASFYKFGGRVGAFFNGAGRSDDSGVFLPAATWTHVAMTYDGVYNGIIKFFVNGALVNSMQSYAYGLTTINSALHIGASPCPGPEDYSGLMDEVRLYNRALTEEEIQELYSVSDKIVAYYPFNGNADDESGNDNDGIVYGATLCSDRFGNSNSAYYFNGTSSIEIADNDSLDLASQISISAWVKVDDGLDADNGNAIISKSESGWWNESYALFASVNDYSSNFCAWFGYDNINSGYTVPKNSWEHVCATYDGNIVKFYIGGVLTNSVQYGKGLQPNNADLIIGRSPNGADENFSGVIDEVRIYKRVLTEDEIQALSN